MSFSIGLVVGLFCGMLIGVVVMCLMQVAKQSDEYLVQMEQAAGRKEKGEYNK